LSARSEEADATVHGIAVNIGRRNPKSHPKPPAQNITHINDTMHAEAADLVSIHQSSHFFLKFYIQRKFGFGSLTLRKTSGLDSRDNLAGQGSEISIVLYARQDQLRSLDSQ
jgi:hypothetical protein